MVRLAKLVGFFVIFTFVRYFCDAQASSFFEVVLFYFIYLFIHLFIFAFFVCK